MIELFVLFVLRCWFSTNSAAWARRRNHSLPVRWDHISIAGLPFLSTFLPFPLFSSLDLVPIPPLHFLPSSPAAQRPLHQIQLGLLWSAIGFPGDLFLRPQQWPQKQIWCIMSPENVSGGNDFGSFCRYHRTSIEVWTKNALLSSRKRHVKLDPGNIPYKSYFNIIWVFCQSQKMTMKYCGTKCLSIFRRGALDAMWCLVNSWICTAKEHLTIWTFTRHYRDRMHKLVLSTNSKSHTGFLLVRQSITLNDL